MVIPPIAPGYEDWWTAFWELSTDRSIGMAVGPIPAASIDRHTVGWSDADRETFRACMRAMDRVYLRHAQTGGLPDVPEQTPRETFRAAMKRPTAGGR